MGKRKDKRRQLAAQITVGKFLLDMNERINTIAQASLDLAEASEQRDAELRGVQRKDNEGVWKYLNDHSIEDLRSLMNEHIRDWQECERRISLYVAEKFGRLDRLEKLAASNADVLKAHGNRIEHVKMVADGDREAVDKMRTMLSSYREIEDNARKALRQSSDCANVVNRVFTEVRGYDNRIRGVETALRLPRPDLTISDERGDQIIGGSILDRKPERMTDMQEIIDDERDAFAE